MVLVLSEQRAFAQSVQKSLKPELVVRHPDDHECPWLQGPRDIRQDVKAIGNVVIGCQEENQVGAPIGHRERLAVVVMHQGDVGRRQLQLRFRRSPC
jgi:hypothetical protein